jgi:hypothetical protein
LVSDIQAGDGKLVNLFYGVDRRGQTGIQSVVGRQVYRQAGVDRYTNWRGRTGIQT